MSDQVIGRVKVRVMPDTSLFAKKAKKDLEREERKLPKLKVEFETDYRSLKTAALKDLRKLNAELREDKYKVQFRATISEAGMRLAVKKAVRELNALAKTETVHIRAEALATKVEAELDKASLTAMNDELNAYIKRISPKRVYVTPMLTPGALGVVDARLDNLTKPRVAEVIPSIGLGGGTSKALDTLMKFSGARLGLGIFKEFREFFENIDKKVPLIGSLAVAVLGLAGGMLSAAGNTFALSRALAQIGPGALALPGIFGGIAIGVAATAAVFKDFNKELPTVKTRLSAIQDSMSAEFWKRARQPIAEMVDTLLPKFARGLDGTARALGVFFANLANGLRSELGGNAIGNMFADLNSSIREMAKHTGSIARLIRIFGEAGAGRLPELARWVGKLTDRFADFMAEAEKTGRLDFWIDRSISRIKELGRVVANAGKLFTGLARAADNAAPGDALTSLADGLEKAQKVVNGSTFQRKLTGALKAAHTMMRNISQRSGPAFANYWSKTADSLTKTLPVVGRIIGTLLNDLFTFLADDHVQTGILKLVQGVERGVNKLTPIFPILAEKAGASMELIGEMADTFGGTFAASVKTITPLLTVLLKVLTKFVDLIGDIPEPILQMAIAMAAANKAMSVFSGLQLGAVSGGFAKSTAGFKNMKADLGILATTWMTAGATSQREAERVRGAQERLKSSLAGVGQMARAASGGLGIMLLSMAQTNDGANGLATTLENTLGAALLGLSVGGPIGAAIGAVVGLGASFKSLQQGIADALLGESEWNQSAKHVAEMAKAKADATKRYTDMVDGLKLSLDQFNASATGQTRLQALDGLEKILPGVTAEMDKLGISQRTLSLAATGNAQAIQLINDVYAAAPFGQFKFGQDQITNALSETTTAFHTARDAALGEIQVTQDLSSLYGKLPKSVATQINLTGIQPTIAGVTAVAKKYSIIDRKQIVALIKASGVEATQANIQKVIDRLKGVDKVKPDLKPLKDGVKAGTDKAAAAGNTGAQKVAKQTKLPLEKLKANLLPFSTSVNRGVQAAAAPAKAQAQTVGTNIMAGLGVGLYTGSGPLNAAAAYVINQALATMRRTADIHSPSRETRTIGQQMLAGLVRGLKVNGALGRSAAFIITAIAKGITGSSAKAVEKALNNLSKTLPKKASASFKKHVGEMRGDLLKLVNQWQSVTDQIKNKLTEIKTGAENFRDTVRDAVLELGNPTKIEVDSSKTALNFGDITKNMDDAIAKAKKWASVLDTLKKLGLNGTTFEQIMSAGPEAALAAAEAIARAGQSGVDALNKQQKELDKYATQAGKTAYQQFYENGLAMADGLLKGLKDKQAELEKQMAKLGAALVRAIKKALGIHSPSRVMRKVGGYTGAGFVQGISDTQQDAEKAITKLSAFRPRSIDVNRSLAAAGTGGSTSKTVNYYAAPGDASLSGEDALFNALNRARSYF